MSEIKSIWLVIGEAGNAVCGVVQSDLERFNVFYLQLISSKAVAEVVVLVVPLSFSDSARYHLIISLTPTPIQCYI